MGVRGLNTFLHEYLPQFQLTDDAQAKTTLACVPVDLLKWAQKELETRNIANGFRVSTAIQNAVSSFCLYNPGEEDVDEPITPVFIVDVSSLVHHICGSFACDEFVWGGNTMLLASRTRAWIRSFLASKASLVLVFDGAPDDLKCEHTLPGRRHQKATQVHEFFKHQTSTVISSDRTSPLAQPVVFETVMGLLKSQKKACRELAHADNGRLYVHFAAGEADEDVALLSTAIPTCVAILGRDSDYHVLPCPAYVDMSSIVFRVREKLLLHPTARDSFGNSSDIASSPHLPGILALVWKDEDVRRHFGRLASLMTGSVQPLTFNRSSLIDLALLNGRDTFGGIAVNAPLWDDVLMLITADWRPKVSEIDAGSRGSSNTFRLVCLTIFLTHPKYRDMRSLRIKEMDDGFVDCRTERAKALLSASDMAHNYDKWCETMEKHQRGAAIFYRQCFQHQPMENARWYEALKNGFSAEYAQGSLFPKLVGAVATRHFNLPSVLEPRWSNVAADLLPVRTSIYEILIARLVLPNMLQETSSGKLYVREIMKSASRDRFSFRNEDVHLNLAQVDTALLSGSVAGLVTVCEGFQCAGIDAVLNALQAAEVDRWSASHDFRINILALRMFLRFVTVAKLTYDEFVCMFDGIILSMVLISLKDCYLDSKYGTNISPNFSMFDLTGEPLDAELMRTSSERFDCLNVSSESQGRACERRDGRDPIPCTGANILNGCCLRIVRSDSTNVPTSTDTVCNALESSQPVPSGPVSAAEKDIVYFLNAFSNCLLHVYLANEALGRPLCPTTIEGSFDGHLAHDCCVQILRGLPRGSDSEVSVKSEVQRVALNSFIRRFVKGSESHYSDVVQRCRVIRALVSTNM